MAGMNRQGRDLSEIIQGSCHLGGRRIEQMETADDVCYPLVPTHLLGIGNDVADSCMGTARDNDKPLVRLIGQGGIIQKPGLEQVRQVFASSRWTFGLQRCFPWEFHLKKQGGDLN